MRLNSVLLLFFVLAGVCFAQTFDKSLVPGKWVAKYEVDPAKATAKKSQEFLKKLKKEGRIDAAFSASGAYTLSFLFGKQKDSATGTWKIDAGNMEFSDTTRHGKAVPKDKRTPFKFKILSLTKNSIKLAMPGMPAPTTIVFTRAK